MFCRLYSHYLHQSRLMRWPANPSDFHDKSLRAVTKFEDCASSRTERECAFDACLLNNTKGTPTSQQVSVFSTASLSTIVLWEPNGQLMFLDNPIAKYDYSRFLFLLQIKITVMGNKMCVSTATFATFVSQIKQI